MISAGQNTGFSTNKTLNLSGRLVSLETPIVMGILNVTPDSFYDGGKFTQEQSIVEHVAKMLAEGAAIVDIGGYSSRPGASDVTVEEEKKRVIPVIKLIKKHFNDVIISIDTFRSSVAQEAIDEGALMINDISGGARDVEMFKTVAELKVPYICMHMKGTPETMNSLASYENLIHEIIANFQQKLSLMISLGIKDIILDPGFGFAKTVEHNFELLNGLDRFQILEKPILVGLSRKSMIWKTLSTTPNNALNGTTALHMAALNKGASILRVHDVKEAIETINLFSNLSPAHTRV